MEAFAALLCPCINLVVTVIIDKSAGAEWVSIMRPPTWPRLHYWDRSRTKPHNSQTQPSPKEVSTKFCDSFHITQRNWTAGLQRSWPPSALPWTVCAELVKSVIKKCQNTRRILWNFVQTSTLVPSNQHLSQICNCCPFVVSGKLISKQYLVWYINSKWTVVDMKWISLILTLIMITLSTIIKQQTNIWTTYEPNT